MQALRILAATTLAALSFGAHAVGQWADLSIYDRAARRELPVYWHEGQAYVVGNPGNEYQVTLRSRSGEDLLAVVSVDGVNVLSGETAHTQQGGYVMGGGARVAIRGWRKSLDEIASFYFTSLGDSYAARTGRPANVGVIGVALFQRKPRYEPAPYSEAVPDEFRPPLRRNEMDSPREKRSLQAPAAPAASAAAPPAYAESAPLGTGHGRRETSHVRWTQFERSTSEPVERITIRYDSYRNLVARGILVAPIAPRNPQPFPGFVPDPV